MLYWQLFGNRCNSSNHAEAVSRYKPCYPHERSSHGGNFTKSSSYFIPYQCEFVSDSGKYNYNLYIAKDSKTSEFVYKALLHQKDKGNNELEPVNDNYEAEGYYLNDHTEMIFHIDTCVLIIKGAMITQSVSKDSTSS